jgi:hypothetical protein
MRTIRENAGRLILFSTMVMGFTACSNVKIESLSDVKKDTVPGNEVAKPEERDERFRDVVVYSQRPMEVASVEQVNEQESNSGGTITTADESTAATAEEKKKGISNTAKGAIIGAGVGAVTGAVVSKKKGKGAIIGGVVGAAAGAGVGAVIDKKKKDSTNP